LAPTLTDHHGTDALTTVLCSIDSSAMKMLRRLAAV
jgi:hypothetical protein